MTSTNTGPTSRKPAPSASTTANPNLITRIAAPQPAHEPTAVAEVS